MTNFIKIVKTSNIATITLDKPPLNILNTEDLMFLSQNLISLSKDKNLKIIIFRSEGKVFSAGIDITDHSLEKTNQMLKNFHDLFLIMNNLEIPTLSVITGGCYGGGAEIALFCDFVIASENAHFTHSEIKIGCFPPISLVLLPYLVSNKKALEIILTGNKITAKTALDIGLVNYLSGEKFIEREVNSFVEKITKNSRSVNSLTLKAFKTINTPDLKNKLNQAEKIYLDELLKLEDYKEGIESFINKKNPEWKDC